VYCLDSNIDAKSDERINLALEEYPWKGGFSYINIYTVLRGQIPYEHKPKISSINYASPGWLDILLNPDVAIKVAESVAILLGAAVTAAKTYKTIRRTLASINKDRKKNDAEIARLTQAETKAIMDMCDELAAHLGFESVQKLHRRTKNPEVSLKLLMAHYRRLEALNEFVKNGKAELPYKNG